MIETEQQTEQVVPEPQLLFYEISPDGGYWPVNFSDLQLFPYAQVDISKFQPSANGQAGSIEIERYYQNSCLTGWKKSTIVICRQGSETQALAEEYKKTHIMNQHKVESKRVIDLMAELYDLGIVPLEKPLCFSEQERNGYRFTDLSDIPEEEIERMLRFAKMAKKLLESYSADRLLFRAMSTRADGFNESRILLYQFFSGPYYEAVSRLQPVII